MTLLVDFNMAEEDGRIPALITPDQIPSLTPGTRVIAADGEGTECGAIVDEVAADGRIVLLVPIAGTTQASTFQPAPPDGSLR